MVSSSRLAAGLDVLLAGDAQLISHCCELGEDQKKAVCGMTLQTAFFFGCRAEMRRCRCPNESFFRYGAKMCRCECSNESFFRYCAEMRRCRCPNESFFRCRAETRRRQCSNESYFRYQRQYTSLPTIRAGFLVAMA